MFHHRVMRRWDSAQRLIVATVSSVMMFAGVAQAATDDLPPLEVVASFSILGDMVSEIGGRHVNVVTIVGPNADSHSFEPTPQAIQSLAKAQVLVANGLNFETWLPRLIESSGFSGAHIVASEGVSIRALSDDGHDFYADGAPEDNEEHQEGHHHHGQIDPHAWQNLKNGMIYVQNIVAGLAQADPARASHYERRAKKYLATMQKLDVEVSAALSAIPPEHRKVITAHDAFGYFADAYGVEFIPVAGLSQSAEPSAKEVAALIDRARQEKRVGIFTEKTSSSKLIEQLAREAGITVGGPLYSDALDDADQPAGTYLGMFHWNAGQFISVLKSEEPLRPE